MLDRSLKLLAELVPRELKILHLLLDGSSAQDIATRLAITVKTVQNCNYQIKVKFDVRTDFELTRFARKHGLI